MFYHPAWASLNIITQHQSCNNCITIRFNLYFPSRINSWIFSSYRTSKCVWTEKHLQAMLKSRRTECLLSFFYKRFLGGCIYYKWHLGEKCFQTLLKPNIPLFLWNEKMPLNTNLISTIFLFGLIWSDYFEKSKPTRAEAKLWVNECEILLKDLVWVDFFHNFPPKYVPGLLWSVELAEVTCDF